MVSAALLHGYNLCRPYRWHNLHSRDSTLPSLKCQKSIPWHLGLRPKFLLWVIQPWRFVPWPSLWLLFLPPTLPWSLWQFQMLLLFPWPSLTLFPLLKPLFLFHIQLNFCSPMKPFLTTPHPMRLDLPVRTFKQGNSIICISMYLIYISPLDRELHESKNSIWF